MMDIKLNAEVLNWKEEENNQKLLIANEILMKTIECLSFHFISIFLIIISNLAPFKELIRTNSMLVGQVRINSDTF